MYQRETYILGEQELGYGMTEMENRQAFMQIYCNVYTFFGTFKFSVDNQQACAFSCFVTFITLSCC